jgi:hypothetical protein
MDLYNVLGIRSDATQSEVKSAYHILAKKFHPDRNSDPDVEEKFKNIVHAYGILIDPEKKREYDRTGDSNPENDDTIVDIDDIIIFDFEVEVSYEDLLNGATRNFRVMENIMVDEYNKEVFPITCPKCNGKIRLMWGIRIDCSYCDDIGQVYDQTCNPGERLREFELIIPPRSWVGRVLMWKNKKIMLVAKEEGNLRSEAELLVYTYKLTIFHALIGLVKEIKILDQVHKIDHPSPIKHESHIRFDSAGIYDSNGRRHDLIIEFKVLFPKHLSPEQYDYMQKCIEIDIEELK